MSPDEEKPARILVEGGPFYKSVTAALCAIGGMLVGFIVAIVILFYAVHQSRISSARFGCEATNGEHVETIKELDHKLGNVKKSLPSGEQTRIAETKAFTVSLINALAPQHKNCGKYANEVIK